MSVIDFTSAQKAPGTLRPPVPRYEIGRFFVTIYYADKRTKPGDAERMGKVARTLLGCLGKEHPMAVNQHHPSVPASLSEGSRYKGTTDEMHDGPHRLAHYHVELIGEQRDQGFAALGLLGTLKDKLASAKWEGPEFDA